MNRLLLIGKINDSCVLKKKIPMNRFGNLLILCITILTLFTSNANQPATGCYWQWMNGNISKDGITKDLEYMKAAGIESAFIFDTWVGVEKGPVDYGRLPQGHAWS